MNLNPAQSSSITSTELTATLFAHRSDRFLCRARSIITERRADRPIRRWVRVADNDASFACRHSC